jgi:hypothetical protein
VSLRHGYKELERSCVSENLDSVSGGTTIYLIYLKVRLCGSEHLISCNRQLKNI